MRRGGKRIIKIIELLERHRFLERWMIETACFRGFSNATSRTQKCREVMARLWRRGQVKRFRNDSREQYIYYLKYSENWPHWILYNTFHFELLRQSSFPRKIVEYEPERWLADDIRTDGFYKVTTTINKDKFRGKKFAVEIDRGTNRFDKIEKYETLKRSDFTRYDWGKDGKFLNRVIVVTERKLKVPEYFRLTNIEEIKRDAWGVVMK